MQADEIRRRVHLAAGGRLGVAYLAGLAEPDLRRLAARHGVSVSGPPPSPPPPSPPLPAPPLPSPPEATPQPAKKPKPAPKKKTEEPHDDRTGTGQ